MYKKTSIEGRKEYLYEIVDNGHWHYNNEEHRGAVDDDKQGS